MSMIRVLKDDLMYRILRNALNCRLHVKLDNETPGYGNCWYYSVMQQIRRPDILPYINTSIRSLNEKEITSMKYRAIALQYSDLSKDMLLSIQI